MSEWVSVEDKLPEEGEKVLIGSFYGDGMPEYQHVAKYHGYEWSVEFGTYSMKNSASMSIRFSHFEDGEWEITHWQPLPKPPKEANK